VFADRFIEAFNCFYQTREKQPVIAIAETILAPYGGRLHAGFSIGKE
jgi:hypothetical protein